MWVRREKERELQAAGKGELPWPLYLVASVLVAIASVSVCATMDRVLQCGPFKLHACITASLPPLLHKLTADLCCAAVNRLGLCLSTLTATLCLASSHQTAHCGRQCWGCLPSLASPWQVGRWVGAWVGPCACFRAVSCRPARSTCQHFLATACPASATQPAAAALLLPLHIHMCVCCRRHRRLPVFQGCERSK